MQVDVVIVGAGPAGIATALHLVSANLQVVVIDKATFPRDKICGDGLTTSCLRELEALGFDPSSVQSWQRVDDVTLIDPHHLSHRFELPRNAGTYAAVAERADLDAALVDLAIQRGVRVRQGTALESADMTPDGVRITTSAGPLDARLVVGADGMWSPLRRHLGGGDSNRGEWHAFRQYFANVTGPAARELVVSFEADLLPGYFWAFPLPGGRANVGFGILRTPGESVQHMGALWSELLERPHLKELLGPDAEPEGTRRAWPIPARIGALPMVDRRAIFVGDAVAACDPMTGEGIGQALMTGRLAAEAIATHFPDPTAVGAAYERAVRAELGPDYKMATALMRPLAHPRAARWAIRIAALTPWTRRNFVRWMFEDEPRGVLLTPRRWNRTFLRRPGTFRGSSA